MLILHLSDIHFKEPLCHTDEDPELHFRSELAYHAVDQASKYGDVGALVVSGDIAFKGHQSEFQAATEWLEELAESVGCNKRRIYVVPGNHDVDRNVYNRIGGARNAIRAITIAGTNDAREAELNTQLGVEDSAENIFAPIKEFNLFAAKYDCQLYPGRLCWKHELRIDENTVLLLHGLNSALISGIDDNDLKPGELYMGSRQLNVPRTRGGINLVMAHHPPEWMSDHEDINTRILGAPNIVLFGHKHVQRVLRDQDGYIMFSAGSVNPERHEKGWEPAYNLIDLQVEGSDEQRTAEVVVRQYHWQSSPSGFVEKMNIETNEPLFRHTIRVNGTNNVSESKRSADDREVEAMNKNADEPSSSPTFSTPNLRNLIYRFWDLSPQSRRSLLTGLGAEIPDNLGIKEPMIYRKELVKLAEENKLTALDSAISKMEAEG